jgi:hypothetical protein
VYDVVVQYFDENDGASTYTMSVNGRQIDRWIADDVFPSREPNGHTSTRRVVRGVRLAEGDTIRLDATPDKDERASVDYIEMIPQPR